MRPVLALVPLALAATPAAANEFAPAIMSYLETEIRAWSDDPRLVAAVAAQNAATAAYPQDEIDRLDQLWRAEVGAPDSALIRGVLDNPASAVLRDRMDASGGAITEIFLMDARGLNVAASGLTSDYWQGDEEKFTETVPKGAAAVHLSEVELDESSQRYQVQVSLPLVDAATGAVVGAMTVGLDAERLD